jgi:hypothetical protein
MAQAGSYLLPLEPSPVRLDAVSKRRVLVVYPAVIGREDDRSQQCVLGARFFWFGLERSDWSKSFDSIPNRAPSLRNLPVRCGGGPMGCLPHRSTFWLADRPVHLKLECNGCTSA